MNTKKLKELIEGKTIIEAYIALQGSGITQIRPVEVDGEPLMVTLELRSDRVDVVLTKGYITEVVAIN